MRVATDEPNCRLTARGVPGMRNCFYQNSVLAVDVNINDILSAQNQSPTLVHIFTMKIYLVTMQIGASKSLQSMSHVGYVFMSVFS